MKRGLYIVYIYILVAYVVRKVIYKYKYLRQIQIPASIVNIFYCDERLIVIDARRVVLFIGFLYKNAESTDKPMSDG